MGKQKLQIGVINWMLVNYIATPFEQSNTFFAEPKNIMYV